MNGKKQTPQAKRPKRKKNDWIVIVDVPMLLRVCAVVLMAALALVSLFFVVRRVLPVREFSVVGISPYESAEIIAASGVKRGDLLYSLDENKIEARILEKCPYLISVKIEPIFPNKLRFEVSARNARWYIDVEGSKYALDTNLAVIDETGNAHGLTKLILPNLREVIGGDVPQFGDSDTERKKTLETIAVIRSSSLFPRLTEVDLESRWDIRLVVDGVFSVVMGDRSDLEAKLKVLERILTEEMPQNCVGGSLDISNPELPTAKWETAS